MVIFNALLNLSELKELYSGKPVCVCPLYNGVLNTSKTFEATGNHIVLPEYESLVKLTTKFSPKQAGTGDPSPENVRPISGWDSVKVTLSNESESHDYNIILPETIYGGTVDAVAGVGSEEYIFKELAIADMNNSENFPGWKYQEWINECINNPQQDGSFLALGIYGTTSIADISKGQFWNCNSYHTQIYSSKIGWGGMTQSQIKAAYPDLVVQFCLKLATSKSFKVSQVTIPSLRGENTFFTNGENMDIIYKETSFWG